MSEEAQIPIRQSRRRHTSDDADSSGPSQPKRTRESKPDLRCGPCALMFSQQGLKYLNSPNGSRHRTRDESWASRTEGCRMCEFIFLLVCKEHDKNWGGNDRLIFRNFRNAHLTGTVSGIQLPGIYGLKGSLESEPDKCIITMYPFAEKGKYSFLFTVDEVTIGFRQPYRYWSHCAPKTSPQRCAKRQCVCGSKVPHQRVYES
jgi:hypothetical protein